MLRTQMPREVRDLLLVLLIVTQRPQNPPTQARNLKVQEIPKQHETPVLRRPKNKKLHPRQLDRPLKEVQRLLKARSGQPLKHKRQHKGRPHKDAPTGRPQDRLEP